MINLLMCFAKRCVNEGVINPDEQPESVYSCNTNVAFASYLTAVKTQDKYAYCFISLCHRCPNPLCGDFIASVGESEQRTSLSMLFLHPWIGCYL